MTFVSVYFILNCGC